MSLQTFEVSGFKSIRGAKIDLRPLNVLIGGNGAGKTNLIRAFELLRAVVGQRLGEHVLATGGADVLLHRGAKVTDTLKLAATFETNRTHNAYEVELMPVPGDRLAVREERGAFQPPGHPRPSAYQLGPGTESSLKGQAKTGANARHILQTVSRWQVFHFHDTSPLAKVKQYAAVEDNDALRPDAANLAPFLYRLQQTEPAAYQRIVATVRRIAPFFKNFQLRASPLRPNSMLLEWTEVGSDGYFNAHALSDGTLRFICLATLLLQPDPPSVILIDEPELGLHPRRPSCWRAHAERLDDPSAHRLDAVGHARQPAPARGPPDRRPRGRGLDVPAAHGRGRSLLAGRVRAGRALGEGRARGNARPMKRGLILVEGQTERRSSMTSSPPTWSTTGWRCRQPLS
ncbi:MAG: AAA family ATPase [bacterium]